MSLLSILLFLSLALAPVPDQDPLEITAEMKSFLQDHVDPRGSSKGRLEDLVASLFRGDGLAFNYETVTRTASETFARKGGDCLSFSNLIVAMARELGYKAVFQEVLVMPVWSRRGRLVTLSRHINVVVSDGASAYLLDLQPQVQRIEIASRIISDKRARAHFYNNKGMEYLAEYQLPNARAFFEAAVKLDSDAAFAWINLGVVLAELGDADQAESAYKRALRTGVDTDRAVAMYNLSKLYEASGRFDDEAKYMEQVTRFREQNPYYHFSLGQEAFQSGDYAGAIDHFKAAIKRKSDEGMFHFSLAEAYLQLGQTSTAIEHLKKAVDLAQNPDRKAFYSERLEGVMANQGG